MIIFCISINRTCMHRLGCMTHACLHYAIFCICLTYSIGKPFATRARPAWVYNAAGIWGITRNQCISTKRLNQERPWVRRHFALHGTLFKIPAPNRQRDSIRDVTQCTHGSYEFSELKPSQANEIFQISPMCYASSSSREHATLERHVRYRCY